jgi:hypothetical protein
LNCFIDLVNEILKSHGKKEIHHTFSNEVAVKVEQPTKDENDAKGSIDIFISDKVTDGKKYGIIIENKINNAPDTTNQLVKYIKYAEENHIEIGAVVYLPRTDDKQPPTDDSYDKIYTDQIKHLKDRCIVLPAISQDKDKKNLVDDFLAKCVSFAKDIQAQVYINDYMRLVKKIGGDIMSAGCDKDILAKLLSDEGRPVIEKVLEVWKDRISILKKEICSKLVHEHKEFFQEADDGSIAHLADGDDWWLGICWTPPTRIPRLTCGFWFDTKKLLNEHKEKAQRLLDQYLPNDEPGESGDYGESWGHGVFKFLNCENATLEHTVDRVVEASVKLAENAKFD